MVRLAAFLLRLVLLTFAGALLAGATLTLAAERANPDRPTLVPVAAEPPTLVVPDVVEQAYVFAKGILQDGGFAWRVAGSVEGYAANVVGAQSPAAGAVVVDTGSPTITLTLVRNRSYRERGTPENESPYKGTRIELPAGARARGLRLRSDPSLDPVDVASLPLVEPTAPDGPTSDAMPLPRPAAKARPTRAKKPAVSAKATKPASAAAPAARPPDTAADGAPPEPADAQPLPDRARALASWLEEHKEATASNLGYWLYEHAYIVAGARFGWSQGAEALRVLIRVDRRAQQLWGVGEQTETTARQALAELGRKPR